MESRGSTSGTITAVARASVTITLEMILPMRTKHNSIWWALAGLTIHSKAFHLVKLINFTFPPFRPSIKLFKFATSEMAK